MRDNATAARFTKGFLLVSGGQFDSATTIYFQYNPATLNRTLVPPQTEPSGEERQRSSHIRYKDAPRESFSLEATLDAADQLNRGSAQARQYGIYPQLAALEILFYPKSSEVRRNDQLLQQGQIEVAAGYEAPFILFNWGASRVVPVVLSQFEVHEQIFDNALNPLRATVSLGLRVLSYADLFPQHKGYDYFLNYQSWKERMARIAVQAGPDQ